MIFEHLRRRRLVSLLAAGVLEGAELRVPRMRGEPPPRRGQFGL